MTSVIQTIWPRLVFKRSDCKYCAKDLTETTDDLTGVAAQKTWLVLRLNRLDQSCCSKDLTGAVKQTTLPRLLFNRPDQGCCSNDLTKAVVQRSYRCFGESRGGRVLTRLQQPQRWGVRSPLIRAARLRNSSRPADSGGRRLNSAGRPALTRQNNRFNKKPEHYRFIVRKLPSKSVLYYHRWLHMRFLLWVIGSLPQGCILLWSMLMLQFYKGS